MQVRHLLVASAAFVSLSALAAGQPPTSSQRGESPKMEQHESAATQRNERSQMSQPGAQSSQEERNESAQTERNENAQMGQSQHAQTVREAQEKLASKGYNPGTPDGKLGPKTEAQIKKFQKDNNLKSNGQLDQKTLAALGISQNSSMGSSNSSMKSSDKESSGH